MLGSPEPPFSTLRQKTYGGALADHVHVRLARVHVRAGDERAAERLDEVAVALEQAAPVVALGNLRHREHGLAAAARQAEHGQLARHARPRAASRPRARRPALG